MGVRRILVVEDEPALRVLLERYLTRQGFEVTTSACAEDALPRLGTPFDFCLIDLTLPGMTGMDLAYHVLKCCPAARVVLTSGHPVDLAQLSPAPGPRVEFLHKPFASRELYRILTQDSAK